MFTNKASDASTNLVDQATQAAQHALQSSQQVASHAMDSVRDTSHYLRVKAENASESTVNYIKHEPVKSVLIAAATGAALMALINLVSHSRNRN